MSVQLLWRIFHQSYRNDFFFFEIDSFTVSNTKHKELKYYLNTLHHINALMKLNDSGQNIRVRFSTMGYIAIRNLRQISIKMRGHMHRFFRKKYFFPIESMKQ